MQPEWTIRITPDAPVPPFLRSDVAAKLAYVDERVTGATISHDGDLIVLTLAENPAAKLRQLLARRVQSLVAAMCIGAFDPEIRVLEEHAFAIEEHSDPTPQLMARRELVQEGPGYFVLGPLLSRFVAFFEEELVRIAARLHAAPYRFPALISPAYLEKVRYFANFPHSLCFATHLRENLDDIQEFSAQARVENGRVSTGHGLYAPPPAMLAPTVCHHLYLTLQGAGVPPHGITATASGNCFRWEARNMISLERVWNFTMREIIFVGSEEHVRRGLDAARSHIRSLLGEIKLSHTVMTATDPFFVGTFRDQAAYQAAFELKYEIRALLPYKRDTVAVGSYNRHGDFFGKTLEIKLADGSPAHTGCIGIGFERLAHAFVSQHGIDPQRWPQAVRDAVARQP